MGRAAGHAFARRERGRGTGQRPCRRRVAAGRDDGWDEVVSVDADTHQVVADVDQGVAVAAAAIGFGRSLDGGATWDWTADGLHASYCRAVAIAGDTALFIGVTGPTTTRARCIAAPARRRAVRQVPTPDCRGRSPSISTRSNSPLQATRSCSVLRKAASTGHPTPACRGSSLRTACHRCTRSPSGAAAVACARPRQGGQPRQRTLTGRACTTGITRPWRPAGVLLSMSSNCPRRSLR